jgi:hypothetical protein
MTDHIQTWTDGYIALRTFVWETRGGIETETNESWPRSTGDDVVAIAALFDPEIRAHGTPGVVRRWLAALDDIERSALTCPHETFRANGSFWASLEVAAVFLDDLAISPPEQGLWDALFDQLGQPPPQPPRNAGPTGDGPFAHFDNVKSYSDLYFAEYKYLIEKRGADKKPPPPGAAGFEKDIPRTTNTDVIALAAYWSQRLADVKHVMGREGIENAWKATLTDLDAIAKHGKPDDVYSKNNEFWRALANTAFHISGADEAPTQLELAIESVKDSLRHLPETLSHAAEKGAELVADAAHAVGKVANEAGKGLFAGFGTPLLIGAGLIGLFLITRSHDREKEA